MTRIFIIIIFLIAAIAIFTMWTRPLWDEIIVLRNEKNAAEKAVGRLYDLRQTRDNLLSEYNTISRDDIGRLNGFLPLSAERGKLLVELENVAKTHSVVLRKIDIAAVQESTGARATIAGAKPKTKEPFEEMPFTILVSGSYDSFRSFLSDLEKSLRLVDVNEISFNASERGTYDYSIKAHAYWLKE